MKSDEGHLAVPLEHAALVPCPHCGAAHDDDRDGPVLLANEQLWRYVFCNSCGASGPECPTASAAIAAWNRRPAATQAVSPPPQGFALVPIEPTQAMVDAAFAATVWPDMSRATSAYVLDALRANMVKEYVAMIAAAPAVSPPAEEQSVWGVTLTELRAAVNVFTAPEFAIYRTALLRLIDSAIERELRAGKGTDHE